MSVPGVMDSSYNYDGLNRLTSMQTVCDANASGCTPGQAMASYSYTLRAAGNRLSVAELSGRTVAYTYDDLYRLTSETISNVTPKTGQLAISTRWEIASS